eukprot:5741954-Prymnesium_polylepis.2
MPAETGERRLEDVGLPSGEDVQPVPRLVCAVVADEVEHVVIVPVAQHLPAASPVDEIIARHDKHGVRSIHRGQGSQEGLGHFELCIGDPTQDANRHVRVDGLEPPHILGGEPVACVPVHGNEHVDGEAASSGRPHQLVSH